MFVLTGLIGGFGQGLICPALSTYFIDIIGGENKGLAISLYLAFFDIGMGFGSIFLGGYLTFTGTDGCISSQSCFSFWSVCCLLGRLLFPH
jgi:MFS family permease